MNKWKSLLSIAVAMSLAVGPAAMAEITIPPLQVGSDTAVTTTETSSDGPGAVQNPAGPADSQETGQTGSAANLTEPVVVAEGAVLMDAATGQVLYGKNQDQQFYPASITKVMTALLVLENCSLDETVTFSATATTNLESGSVSLGITAGDQLTVEQCLYGLLLKSANEIGNGLAEHVSGSISGFAERMNARAKELGCLNTNFVNPHGLNNSSHKTTPYDMALILRAALQNENFRKIDTTLTYNFPATKNVKARTITMGHKMMYPSDSRYYEGIIGGKTGYTSLAGNTLVTGAERNGVRLIAVVMKSSGTHYTDTKALLDYGFENYAVLTGSNAAAASNTGTGWRQDNQGWQYQKTDGTMAAGEWVTDQGLTYWIDASGYMATGWRQFSDGTWYYFKPAGNMAKSCWVLDEGDWFYLGADGKLLQNTTTPDGYQVNENGIWQG